MRVIILAAGYATRLYPLTLDRPKPLLPVAGRSMLDRILDSLATIEGVSHIDVITNAKFAAQFERWADTRRQTNGPVYTIINDGSTDDSNKLGAIGDLLLALERGGVDDDIIVAAGDNLFSETLEGFGAFCRDRATPVLAVYDVGSLAEITKYNAIDIDADGRILFFEEKPANPTSTLTGIALYYYPQVCLPLIKQYVAEGNNPDQPGRLVQWMYQRTPFYTWRVPGIWYDIGSKETLQEADRIFSARKE